MRKRYKYRFCGNSFRFWRHHYAVRSTRNGFSTISDSFENGRLSKIRTRTSTNELLDVYQCSTRPLRRCLSPSMNHAKGNIVETYTTYVSIYVHRFTLLIVFNGTKRNRVDRIPVTNENEASSKEVKRFLVKITSPDLKSIFLTRHDISRKVDSKGSTNR